MNDMKSWLMAEAVPAVLAVGIGGAIIAMGFMQIEPPKSLDMAFGAVITYLFAGQMSKSG